MRAVSRTDLSGLELLQRGKVRDIYVVDADHLLLVASDRISAFDVVLPRPVPGKGIVLTQLSLFWFELFEDVTSCHLVESDVDAMPAAIHRHADVLRGRSLLVRRAEVFPVECIVRAYLLGSGWKDYQATGSVCGIPLEPGLRKNHRFSSPLFTPSTKAEAGSHDENIAFEAMTGLVGADTAEDLRQRSLAVFERATNHAFEHGVIICDTKLEWGRRGDEIMLVDEVFTPDSSRFWRLEDARGVLEDGGNPPSFDKQVVRDHLETLDWDKTAPGPELPDEILSRARRRYVEIYERITGQPVPHLEE